MESPAELGITHCAVNLHESIAKGHTSPWTAWRCLNRLRTGVTCSKEQRDGSISTETQHASVVRPQCPLLAHPCTLDDLLKFNKNAK